MLIVMCLIGCSGDTSSDIAGGEQISPVEQQENIPTVSPVLEEYLKNLEDYKPYNREFGKATNYVLMEAYLIIIQFFHYSKKE